MTHRIYIKNTNEEFLKVVTNSSLILNYVILCLLYNYSNDNTQLIEITKNEYIRCVKNRIKIPRTLTIKDKKVGVYYYS